MMIDPFGDRRYWCPWCRRALYIDDGLIIHDDVFQDYEFFASNYLS